MGTVRYTVIDGEIIAEKRAGVRSLYVPDPLGSTVALLGTSQTQTDTFSFWPYGENNARTGTTATPFQFVGTAGYHRDSANRTYVRARTLRTDQGRWITQDPIRFRSGSVNWFAYCGNGPVRFRDPRGLDFWTWGPSDHPWLDFHFSKSDWIEISRGIDRIADWEIGIGTAVVIPGTILSRIGIGGGSLPNDFIGPDPWQGLRRGSTGITFSSKQANPAGVAAAVGGGFVAGGWGAKIVAATIRWLAR